jgi:hypothetical protein
MKPNHCQQELKQSTDTLIHNDIILQMFDSLTLNRCKQHYNIQQTYEPLMFIEWLCKQTVRGGLINTKYEQQINDSNKQVMCAENTIKYEVIIEINILSSKK